MLKMCKSCPDFLMKQQHADILEQTYGEAGIWDFRTCHNSCWKEPRSQYYIKRMERKEKCLL